MAEDFAPFVQNLDDQDVIVINRLISGVRKSRKIKAIDLKSALAVSEQNITQITNIINNIFEDGVEELPPSPNDGQIYYLQLNSDGSIAWELVSDLTVDRNVDGGFPNSVYLPSQNVNGGTP